MRNHTYTSALFRFLITALLLICLAKQQARAQAFTVTSLADDGSVGTLRVAINDANAKPGSTIKFGVSGMITLSSTLPEVTAAMTIQGPAGSPVLIDGAGKYQVFFLNATNGTVTVSNITVQNGFNPGGPPAPAGHGGGIWAGGATVMISNCTFLNNYAAFGGGISCGGNVVLAGCTFTGNSSSSWGSGGLETYGTVSITNCTLTGNSCSGSPGGGAIMIAGSTSMTNCTITGNSGNTGGIWCWQGAATLTNCILYGDGSEVGFDTGTLTASFCDIHGGYAGTGNFDADPMFGTLGDNGGPTETIALLAGSPCYNSGTKTGSPLTDQRGYTRPNPPSLGAYDVAVPVLSSVSPNTGAVGSPTMTITLNGSNFLSTAKAKWNAATLTTSYISSTKLTATVLASDLAALGTFNISVANPGAGGGASKALPFKVISSGVTITLTAPTNTAAVKGTVTVTGTITDSLAATGNWTLTCSGIQIGSGTGASPSVSWNTAVWAEGNHALVLSEKDAAGNTRGATVTVTVNNKGVQAIAITSPASGAAVKGIVTVTGSITDATPGSWTLVDNGVTIGSGTGISPSVSWDTTKMADGSNKLVLTETDAAGHTGSATTTVTVNNKGVTSIKITAPASGEVIKGSVTVTGAIVDATPGTWTLTCNGIQIGIGTGISPSVKWDTTQWSNGTHKLVLMETDAAGNVASVTINVTVGN